MNIYRWVAVLARTSMRMQSRLYLIDGNMLLMGAMTFCTIRKAYVICYYIVAYGLNHCQNGSKLEKKLFWNILDFVLDFLIFFLDFI
jgi:hypothetical protein